MHFMLLRIVRNVNSLTTQADLVDFDGMNRGLTGHRQRVLQCLQNSEAPLSALDLYRSLSDTMNLATVYRALPVLEQEGLVEALSVDCVHEGTTRYFLAAGGGHRHFFHCTRCHRFYSLGDCDIHSLIGAFQATSGHRVEGHSLSLTGICRECQAVAS